MNCSGKHAAMLLTSVLNDWPIETYREPGHPLQQAIRTAVEDIAGEKVSYVAVDGCGAPILAISLAGLARSFGLFAAAAPGTLEARVKDAFREYPEYASGSMRDEAALMRAIPGLFCKVGAESVYAVGLEDGRGIALKVEDGTPRARAVVMAAVLKKLGLEHEVLDQQSRFPLLGGGVEVGAVQPHPSTFS